MVIDMKKQMILALLLSAALTGCAHKDAGAQAGRIETGMDAGEGTQTGNAAQADGMRAEEVRSDGMQTEGMQSDSMQTEGMQSGNAAQAGSVTQMMDTAQKPPVGEDGEKTSDGIEYIGFGDVATMDNNFNGRELPIYCVDTEEKKVALSFDAAWGNEDTTEILAILENHDIHVTFFVTGGWVESYPEDVKAILAAGHDLGNHSENHPNMSGLSDEEKTEELMAVHRKVKEITGYDMFLFRPPYGDYDNAVIDVAKTCGYYAIQWDVDSLDWKNEGLDNIIETVTQHKHLGNGSIILCHNGAEYTAQALETLITELEGQGYAIVPVSELIYKDNFHMNFEGRQIKD